MNFNDPKFTTVLHRNVWGEWTFVLEGAKLCGLCYSGLQKPSSIQACAYASPDIESQVKGRTAQVYKKAVNELNQYLAGKLKKFSVPIKLYGTEFQIKVLESIQNIPYGETWTYQQVADSIGHPKAVRAVGNALHQNPLQVIVPCHRVVSTGRGIGGYALGTDLKRRLLCMEGAIQNELNLE